jgi:chaperonin GroES
MFVDSREWWVMKIRPLGDRIVIRRFQEEEKTTGGILLPDSAKKKPQKGKVLAVGPGKLVKDGTRRPLQVKEGDVVLFTSWAGDEFREGMKPEQVLLMREEDVLAVLDE